MSNDPGNKGNDPVQIYLQQTGRRISGLYTRSKKTYEVLSKLVVQKSAPPSATPQKFIQTAAPVALAQEEAPNAEEVSQALRTLGGVVCGILFLGALVVIISTVQRSSEAQTDFNQGIDAVRTGNNQRALQLLNHADSLGFRQNNLFLLRAAAKAGIDDQQHAVDDFTAVLNSDPRNAVALIGRASCYLKLRDFEHAFADCEAALKARKEFPDAVRVRAEVYAAAGKFQEAVDDCDEYLSVSKQSTDAEVMATRAFANFKLGQPEKAIKDLDQLIAATPKQSDLYSLRAQCLMKMSKLDKALADLNTALNLNPADMKALALRAGCYSQLNKPKEALADLDLVVKHEPSVEHFTLHGDIALQLKKYEQAIDDYDQALSFSPGNPTLRTKKDEAYKLFKKTQPVIASIKETISDRPLLPKLEEGGSATTLKGYDSLRRGKVDQAIPSFINAVRANPTDPAPRRYLAYAYLGGGNTVGAVEQFQALIGMNKANETDQMQYARALTALGRNQQAVELLKDLLSRNPANTWARMALIKLYMDSGTNDKAAKLCQDGLSVATTDRDRGIYQSLLQRGLGNQ